MPTLWSACKPIYMVKEAEEEGFEPPDLLQSTVFKTAAFDHSASSPRQKYGLKYFNPKVLQNYLLLIFVFYHHKVL